MSNASNLTMYQHCVARGIPIENHASDLYIPVTPETNLLVASYPFREQVSAFLHNVHRTMWYDIPFAYEPWFERTA